MPDKDYLKKVYNFLSTAYGARGAVSPNAFTIDFGKFSDRIRSSKKYADQIFGALSMAYGPKGVYKRDAFTSSIEGFRDKVLAPQQPESAPLVEANAQLATDPAQAVLESAQDMAVPVADAPGLLGDISAFEPVIQAEEAKQKGDYEQWKQQFLNEPYTPPVNMYTDMSPEQKEEYTRRILTDPQFKLKSEIQALMKRLDEEDKNRLSSQAAADQLYNTPGGKIYYDFVRPIYKGALETAGQTGAFGARLFNADKVADKIVDYFDFDRLAREGNTTAALNMQPTKQQGKLGINNILPRSVEALTNMGLVLGGSSMLKAGQAGLLGSTFATQYEGYRKAAKEAGLDDVDADKYAFTSAGVNSMLELVSPNKVVFSNMSPSLMKRTVLEAIREGGSIKATIKKAVKEGLKEIGHESAQELAQNIGDKSVKYAFDQYVLNDPAFHQENILPSAREALETIILTSISTGVLSTPGIIAKNRVPALERSAWAAAAREPQAFEEGLNKAVSSGHLTQEKADKLREDVSNYKEIYDSISTRGYEPDVVERMAMNAYRSKKIDDQNKPIAGIPVLNAITEQDKAVNVEIEKEILSAISGQPETIYDRPGDNIVEPEKIIGNAVQEQATDESVLRQEQPELGLQEMVEGDAEPEELTTESTPVQPVEQQEEMISAADMTTQKLEEARDRAKLRLKTAWDAQKTTGIISDPERNLKRDKELYSALASYVKQEILYRINQVKGFAQERKARIKRAITTSLKEEGIGLKDISMLNDAFEEAFAQIKKIPGMLPEEPNDRITFRDLIRDRIRVREAGRRAGFREGSAPAAANRVKQAKAAIFETLKKSGIKLNLRQLRSIFSVFPQAAAAQNANMNKVINKAVNKASQLLWEAKNQQKINKAKSLVKSINRLKRSKSMVLQDQDWIGQTQFPSPSKVDDLDTYVDMLGDFLKSRRADELDPKYTKEEISEFIDQENDRIYEEKRSSIKEDLDELKQEGVIPEDVTLDEYIGMLSGQKIPKWSEGISKKQEVLKPALKEKLNLLKDRLPEFDDEGEKDLVAKLSSIDPSVLDGTDLIRLNNVLNNIAEFGTLDAAGDILTTYEGKKAGEKIAMSGNKIRQLPDDRIIRKKNLSNILSALSFNDEAVAQLRALTIGPIERKLSPVYKKAQTVVKEFVDLNRKYRIGPTANARLHAYSFLNQYHGIENAEIADDLAIRLDELLDDAHYFVEESNRMAPEARTAAQALVQKFTARDSKDALKNAKERLDALEALGFIEYRIEESKEDGRIVRTLFTNRLADFNPDAPLKEMEAAWDKMSAGERSVYNFVRKHYDELTDKLEFVTRAYAAKAFQRERNYVSLVAQKKSGERFNDQEMSADTDITQSLKSVDRRPSGTTVRRTERKPASVYYNGDFFSNFINRYYQSLYTAEVLPALQTVSKTVNGDLFKKYITGQLDTGFKGKKGADNFSKFVGKLAQAVNEGKYSPFFRGQSRGVLDNAATRIISSGVRLALNNIYQGPAQVFPALMRNFAIADTEATGFAIGAAFRSLWDKQYAKDRERFLSNFTGVKRAALGSQAYENYVGRIQNEPGWWVDSKELSKKIHDISAFSLEKGDRAAQSIAYISGYLTGLMKQGKLKNVGDFDISEHAASPDPEALAYAEQIASAINNESAREYKPDVLKDTENSKYLWLLQGFSLNAYQNAMNKAKIIWNNRSTTAERNEAMMYFFGYLGEMATYQMIKGAARGFQTTVAAALLLSLFRINAGETEEEKKEAEKKEKIKRGANALADITLSSQNALRQEVAKAAVNKAYTLWAKSEVAAKKEAGEKFDPRGTHLSPYFVPFYGAGGVGGGAEFYSSFADRAVNAIGSGIGWTSEPSSKKGKTEEQERIEKIAKRTDIVLTAAALILQSGDLVILNNRMQQQLKTAAKKAEHKPGSAASHNKRRSMRSN